MKMYFFNLMCVFQLQSYLNPKSQQVCIEGGKGQLIIAPPPRLQARLHVYIMKTVVYCMLIHVHGIEN
jgi:hypothetical protein